MEMVLDKKQIQGIFSFEFKMGHKAAETTCNFDNAFGPRTANKCTVQSLEEEEHSGWPSEVDNDQLRAITEADSLTATPAVAEELKVDHSVGCLAFEPNWKGEKAR